MGRAHVHTREKENRPDNFEIFDPIIDIGMCIYQWTISTLILDIDISVYNIPG
jgi:hypothetical protein